MAELEKTKEELELEKLVFGDYSAFEEGLKATDFEEPASSDEEQESDLDQLADDQLFFVDVDGDKSDADEDVDMESGDEDEDESESDAWLDSDEDEMRVSLTSSNKLKKLRTDPSETTISGREYEKRLRSQFQKLNPKPKWSDLSLVEEDGNSDNDGGVEDDDVADTRALADILSKKTTYSKSKSTMKFLPTSDLDIGRLQDVTRQLPSKSAIQTLEFHPSHPLVLTGGYDQTLRIYHVDGKVNPVASSLHIKGSPFQTSLFHPDGQRVFAGGRRKYFYIWDLQTGALDKITRMYGHEQTQRSMEKFVLSPDGKYVGLMGSNGWMNVMSAQNGQWITGAKIDGSIADIVWNKDESVTIASTGGDIYDWDVKARKFSNRWRDQAGVAITRIAQTDRWTAVGASNGMVNIYDRTNPKYGISVSDLEPNIWEPKFVLDNLVTTISSLSFSPDGQMLAMASRGARDALRMVHVPSFSVFKNWPTSSTPLGRVTSLAFSPGNQMLSTGNEQGFGRLFSLNHYTS